MKMKIKPEDRPKMIGLLAAIGIMFCYLILVVIPSLSGAQAAPAAAQETAGATPGAPAAAPVTPVSASSPALPPSSRAIMDAGPVPDSRTDPFLSPASNPVTAAPAAPSVITAVSKQAASPMTTPLLASAQATPQSAPKIPPPALTLLGVAGGGEPVAVFQVGENTMEKKKGDAVPGGFRLGTIDADGVTLIQGKTTCRMEVGHTFSKVGK